MARHDPNSVDWTVKPNQIKNLKEMTEVQKHSQVDLGFLER